MSREFRELLTGIRDGSRFETTGATVLVLLVVFLTTLEVRLLGLQLPVGALRASLGILLLTVVPGVLLVRLLDIRTVTFGEFFTYAVGTSLVFTTVVTLVTVAGLGSLGLSNALSAVPLAVSISVGLLLLLALTYWSNGRTADHVPRPQLTVRPVAFPLVLLPVLASAAALQMRGLGSNTAMFAFVIVTVLVVGLTATRFIPRSYYPATVFSVGLSTFLHRSLLTQYPVGADVQALYALAELFREAGSWSPEMGGALVGIPAVTLTPAAVSTLTGLDLATVFSFVHVLQFAFVPVGVYVLGRTMFDPEVSLFGALLFSFYHVSFLFTPGKQLLGGLFVVLLVGTMVRNPVSGWRKVLTLGLLAVGLMFTHYATTYVFGGTLLVAAAGLGALRLVDERVEARIPVALPLLLLGGGTLWYSYGAGGLLETIAGLVFALQEQALGFVSGGTTTGSGQSYVRSQTAITQRLQVFAYVALTGLLALGIAKRTFSTVRETFWNHPRADSSAEIELTAVALPLFCFLGASYVFVFNLWADRVYQMVLVVLGPFAAYGALQLCRLFGRLSPFETVTRRVRWVSLTLVVALLLLNTGFIPAVAGGADVSTFADDAHDLAFTDAEHEAVQWLLANTSVSKTDEYQPRASSRLTVDSPDRVQIYTDTVTYQLFRATAPPAHYNTEIVVFRNKWVTELNEDAIESGYIFVRERSVRESPPDRQLPPRYITPAERQQLVERGTVVYQTDAVTIVRVTEAEDE